MIRQKKRFPLVADDEVLVGENPIMSLYDESDLISNIKGPYQEKDFGRSSDQKEQLTHVQTEEELLPPLFEARSSRYSRKDRLQAITKSHPSHPVKTQGQLAREQAKEDLKKKRSANYLRDEKPASSKAVVKQAPPRPRVNEQKATGLARLADKLRQTSYILADLPPVYSLKPEDRGQEQAKTKNSYDFLKKSQVYNHQERRQQRNRQVAQELNLTHIEEE